MVTGMHRNPNASRSNVPRGDAVNLWMGTVRLSEFINSHLEEILSEWEAFARSRAPAGHAFDAKIRDHADAMLRAIAHDLETSKPDREEDAKSKGLEDSAAPAAEAAAE